MCSLELENYVLQETPCQFLSYGNVNQNFKPWKRHNEMIGCWLMSSMNAEMLKQIFGFNTSSDVETRLEKSYSFKSRVKVIQVKEAH